MPSLLGWNFTYGSDVWVAVPSDKPEALADGGRAWIKEAVRDYLR